MLVRRPALRPILRNGNPFLKFLGNAFTGERILQRPTPRHLWATDRPGICLDKVHQLPSSSNYGKVPIWALKRPCSQRKQSLNGYDFLSRVPFDFWGGVLLF